MLNQNNTTQKMLGVMGITQWRVRENVYTSLNHKQCLFYINLTQALNFPQKTFVIKLYQAIEKLLDLAPSEQLIQIGSKQNANINPTKVTLHFNHQINSPTVTETKPSLIIDLPDIYQCEKTPAIKSALWKILKENII